MLLCCKIFNEFILLMLFNRNVKDSYIFNGWVFELIIDNFKFNISNQIIDIIKPNKILEINQEFDFKEIYQFL